MRWVHVTEDRPCPHCGRGDWCSRALDGQWDLCRRSAGGIARHDRSGEPYWLHKVTTGPEAVSVPVDVADGLLRPQLEAGVWSGQSAWEQPEAQVLLASRGLGPEECDSVPVRWDEENEAMVIPVDPVVPHLEPSVLWRRPEGWPNKWIGPGKDFPKPSYVFGARHLVRSLTAPLVIVEGMFDIVAPGLLGRGIAILGSSISDDQAAWISSRYRNTVVWFDPDRAGRKGARRVARTLRTWGCSVDVFNTAKDPKFYKPGSAEVSLLLGGAYGHAS